MGKANNPDKQRIIQLVSQWRERSGLNFRQVVARIQAHGCDLDETTLRDRLTSRPEREPSLPPDLTLAVVAAFTTGLTEVERCRATEALELADLARLPLNQLEALQQLFPEEEFKQAFLAQVLPLSSDSPSTPPLAIVLDFKPKVNVSREGSNYLSPVDFLMPLYRNDIIYTYEQATTTLYCKENKLILHVPEQNVMPVTCQNKEDKWVVTQLDSLIGSKSSTGDTTLETRISETVGEYKTWVSKLMPIENALQELHLNSISRAGLLFQLYREFGEQEAALTQLEALAKTQAHTSFYLWQTLGELYLEAGQYPQAQAAYQAARECLRPIL